MYVDVATVSYAFTTTTAGISTFWLAYSLEVAVWLAVILALAAIWASCYAVSKLLTAHYDSPGEITRRLKRFLNFAINSLLVTGLLAVTMLGVGLLILARDLYVWNSELAVCIGVLGAGMLGLTALVVCLDFANNQTQEA
jgi:hypothetical protein